MKKCVACGRKNEESALICVHCNFDIQAGDERLRELLESAEWKEATRNEKKSNFLVLGITGTVVVGFIGALLFGGFSGSSSDLSSEIAVRSCKQSVEARLKAPGTANYVNIEARKHLTLEDNYLVEGSVDSENSFGALLRSEFQCTVEGSNGDTTTRLVYLR